ncbi:peptidase C15 [Microcoleus sp. FACHB-1515]|uniref:peptidase C15 n=1 Tax=Cyanophyceae TaxID=3028117 RepID=UPI001684BF3C|nr:peptidase C15 [Microcoleus sp. FACHB-1515]MBD2092552.1 peptidase C15 [Microcoleus sp. FACHB-1515]
MTQLLLTSFSTWLPHQLLLTSFSTWLPHQKSNSADDLLVEFLQRKPSIDLQVLRHLPVDFMLAPQQTIACIQTLQPQAVVCCGMAESRSKLSVESQAVISNTVPGAQSDTVLGAQSDRILKTRFDLPQLVNGLPLTEISHDAGRFVCNATYFAVLEHLQHSSGLGLFVHVPILTEANCEAIVSDFATLLQRISNLF